MNAASALSDEVERSFCSAVLMGDLTQVEGILHNHPIPRSLVLSQGLTPVGLCVSHRGPTAYGIDTMVAYLLDQGFMVDANPRSRMAYPALAFAVDQHSSRCVKTLLEHGASTEPYPVYGSAHLDLYEASLQKADQAGREEMWKVLLDGGIDPKCPSPLSHTTSIMSAVAFKNTKALHDFIGAGVDVNAQDRNGGTALHRAVEKEFTAGVSMLLENGADWSLRNKQGRLPEEMSPEGAPARKLLLAWQQASTLKGATPLPKGPEKRSGPRL